jgi:hypothetical protein
MRLGTAQNGKEGISHADDDNRRVYRAGTVALVGFSSQLRVDPVSASD